jgi:Skp family chaperone for outer membrane proteins
MVVSSRAIVAVGLGLVGLAFLVGPTFGQQDSSVRKSASQSGVAVPAAAAAAPKPPAPTVIGTVDIEAVLKAYDKVKVQQEEYKAAAMAKYNELTKLQTTGQEESQKLAKMTPGSIDAKHIEDRLSELKAKIEAGREQAQREFATRESELLAIWYKEIQDMVRRIAEYQGLTYVVQVSNEPLSGSNPQTILSAMGKTVVYADPRNDITKSVIFNLNLSYKKLSGGAGPKGSTTQAAAASAPAPN